jgi:membrane protein YqaA with SNARE-associated domain
MDYLALFAAAFVAATVLPFYSEALLAGLVVAGKPLFWLWFWATLGNTLGAMVNWWLGRQVLRFQDRKWFPASRAQMEKAQARFNKYGSWILLMAWAPIGGDALTVIGGVMRVPLWWFTILVAIGKGARYALVVGLFV